MVSNVSESTAEQSALNAVLKRVASVSPHAELDCIYLAGSKCQFRTAKNDEPAGPNLEAAVEVNVDDDVVAAIVRLRFHAPSPMAKKRDGEEAVLVSAVFHVIYKLTTTGLPNELVEQFGKINGIFNAWPYWRELLQSTLQRMGLPPIVLPLLTAAGAVSLAGLLEDEEPDEATESAPAAD